MLDFVKRAFRGGINVLLWISLILSTIGGGVAGYYLGRLINYRNAVWYAFGGVVLGIIFGLLTDIIVGGFITTILSIEKNTEEQTTLLKKHLGINYIPVDNQKERKNDSKMNQGIENINAKWKCPKCNNENPNSTYQCRSCGYKLV